MDVGSLFPQGTGSIGAPDGGNPFGIGQGALSGLWAGQRQGAAMAGTDLNLQAQDIANQTAQQALEQGAIKTPVMQAQASQAVQAAQQVTDSAAKFGPQALDSAALAGIAKNYAGMAQSDREKHDTHMRDWQDANALISSKGFDWKNPEHQALLHRELSKSGMADIPAVLSEKDIPRIQAGAAMATNSLEISRQMQLGATQHGYAMELGAQHGEYSVKASEALAGRTPTGYATQLVKRAAAQPGGLDALNTTELGALASATMAENAAAANSPQAKMASLKLSENQEAIAAAKDEPKKVLKLQTERIDLQRDYDKIVGGDQLLSVRDAIRKKVGGPAPDSGTSAPTPTATPSTFKGDRSPNGSAPIVSDKSTYDALPVGSEYSKPGDPPGTIRKKAK